MWIYCANFGCWNKAGREVCAAIAASPRKGLAPERSRRKAARVPKEPQARSLKAMRPTS